MMDNNAAAAAHGDDEKPCTLLIHYGERARTAEGKVGWGIDEITTICEEIYSDVACTA